MEAPEGTLTRDVINCASKQLRCRVEYIHLLWDRPFIIIAVESNRIAVKGERVADVRRDLRKKKLRQKFGIILCDWPDLGLLSLSSVFRLFVMDVRFNQSTLHPCIHHSSLFSLITCKICTISFSNLLLMTPSSSKLYDIVFLTSLPSIVQ